MPEFNNVVAQTPHAERGKPMAPSEFIVDGAGEDSYHNRFANWFCCHGTIERRRIMARTVKIGVIGMGWPGREHLKGYQTFPEAEVVALCDLNTELAEQQAKEHDVPHVYADYKKMLRECEVEAVSVCLPNFLHCPVTLDVLRAGKHVICEKPPAMNAREAQRMANEAEKQKKVLMYALVQRFGAPAVVVKDFIDSGELGEIYFGKAGYVRRRGIPIGAGGWFVDKSRAGGGALIDIGVHALDRAWWLMGNPKPVSVAGSAYSMFGHTVPKGVKYDVDDSAFGLIKFENGATLILEATWALNVRGGSFAQIAGTKGGADLEPLTIFVERKGMTLDVTPTPPQVNAFAGEVEHFVRCILEGKEPGPSAEQGVMLMKMLDGIYRSGETGKEVRIK